MDLGVARRWHSWAIAVAQSTLSSVPTGVSTGVMSPERRGRAWFSLTVLVVLGVGLLAGCGSSAAPSASTGLSGRWASDGYTCPAGTAHHETVEIVQTGSHLVATKVIGDDCVHGGHVSFLGTIKGKVGTVGFWAAQKGGAPTLGAQTQPLQVEGANRFSVTFPGVGLMQFTRASTTSAKSGGSIWWLWVVLVVVVIMGVAAFVRRRRRAAS
jgi:hypothetical protein